MCECHMVSWNDLVELVDCNRGILKSPDDLKLYRIIGHGCGQCLRAWEDDLRLLLKKRQ